MRGPKTVLRALVLIAALAAPVGLMTPAHASTSHDGCTVDPKTPYHNGDVTASGLKRIAYEVEIDCVGGVTIEVDEEMYHRVRFRVSSGPVTGTWTSWEDSATRSIHT